MISGPCIFRCVRISILHAAVTRAFGILREGPPLPGISERAVFIVDKSGRIVFAKVYPLDQTPDDGELLEALKGLQ